MKARNPPVRLVTVVDVLDDGQRKLRKASKLADGGQFEVTQPVLVMTRALGTQPTRLLECTCYMGRFQLLRNPSRCSELNTTLPGG